MPMKVLHICETARGGVGTYIDTLVELEAGHVLSKVVLPDAHLSMLSAGCETAVFRYNGRSLGSIFRLLAVSLRTRLQFSPDIIFCHSSFSLLVLCLLRPLSRRTKFIYCPHGWAGARENAQGIKAAAVRRAEGLLAGLAHRVVNVSQSDLDHAQSHGYRGRQVVIENAVRPVKGNPPSTLFGAEPGLIHLLFVGRHDLQKGLDILLEAFATARVARPDLRLHVIGEPVVADGGQKGPSDGVDYLGWVGADRIDGYYRSADLLVVPSRWEGLPLVVPEALRNGTPVLVSDRSRLPDLIEPGATGLSCNLSVIAFVAALTTLDKAGLTARRPACLTLFATRFHAARLGREIAELYAEVAGS